MMRLGIALPVLAFSLAVLSACSHTTQISSGRDYLMAQPEWSAATQASATAGQGIAQAVYDAANAEPLLRFPAKIGLARIERQRISPIPSAEAEAWVALVKESGPVYGSFEPISPLLAGFSAGDDDAVQSVIDQIRIGAARQHVDAVLIYEVGSSREDAGSILSVLDLTIVGAWVVPSRSIGGKAMASALLIDVRNGYPYGTASASAEESGISTNVGSTDRSVRLAQQAQLGAVRNLATETEAMLAKLKGGLEAKELADLRALKAQGRLGKSG